MRNLKIIFMDESKLKDQNILLVKEKDNDELKAVAGIGKNGKVELVEAKAENASQFLKFDRNDRTELANIMSDFNRQESNPKDFQLFQVRYGKFEKLKEGLEEVLSLPHNPEGKELLKMYEVNPKDFAVKQVVEDPKVLLTQGDDGKLKAIAEGKDGKLKTVDPVKENADSFLKIDTRGNALENFFKKFSEQFKNPSHTGIYAVSVQAVDKMAAFMDKIVRIDFTDKVLDPYPCNAGGKDAGALAGEVSLRPEQTRLERSRQAGAFRRILAGRLESHVLRTQVARTDRGTHGNRRQGVAGQSPPVV
jgi:hypothetical protein